MFPLGKGKTGSSQSQKRGLTVLPLFLLIALLTVQFFLPIRSHLIDLSTLSTGDESQTTTNSTRSTVTIIIPPPTQPITTYTTAIQTLEIPFNGMFLHYTLESTADGSFVGSYELLKGTLHAEFDQIDEDMTYVNQNLNLIIYGMTAPLDTGKTYEATSSDDMLYYLGDWSRTNSPPSIRDQITISTEPFQGTPAQSIIGNMSGTYTYEGTVYITIPEGGFTCYKYRRPVTISISDLPVTLTGYVYIYYNVGTGVLILSEIRAQGTAQMATFGIEANPEVTISITAEYSMKLEESNINFQQQQQQTQQTAAEIPGFPFHSIIIGFIGAVFIFMGLNIERGKRRISKKFRFRDLKG